MRRLIAPPGKSNRTNGSAPSEMQCNSYFSGYRDWWILVRDDQTDDGAPTNNAARHCAKRRSYFIHCDQMEAQELQSVLQRHFGSRHDGIAQESTNSSDKKRLSSLITVLLSRNQNA
jgi:hypothetical protein